MERSPPTYPKGSLVYVRLRSLLTACDQPGEHPLPPGRSGFEFIARLVELERFASSEVAFNPDHYSGASETSPLPLRKFGVISEEHKFQVVEKFSPTNPYRSLDASRLKITGSGNWDMQEFLEDTLWLPFQDPAILATHEPVSWAGPDIKREKKQEYLKLAKIWDSRGLLAAFPENSSFGLPCRVFNAHKNEINDRQIGDRRWVNGADYHPRGPSAYLPSGINVTSLHCPRGMKLVGCASDRKDFYHQARVTRERAVSNIVPFSFAADEAKEMKPWADMIGVVSAPTSRERHGDRLGLPPRCILAEKGISAVRFGFKSLFEGDHLGVEYALSSHTELLKRWGLLDETTTIYRHHVFPRPPLWQGLVIDDFFSVSTELSAVPNHLAKSVGLLEQAEKAYKHEAIIGSDEKTVRGEENFKIIGAEVLSCKRLRDAGIVSVAAPLSKRIPMSMLSLAIAELPCVSRSLASRAAGNWIEEGREVVGLDRRTAEELVLAAVFGLFAATDVSVPYCSEVFATDSSNAKGAFTEKTVDQPLAETIWLGGDKKGTYTMLDPPTRAILRGLGEDTDHEAVPMDFGDPPKVLDFAFDFVEICGGSGTLSKAVAARGLRVCAPIDLASSPHHDMESPKLLNWIFQMISEKRFRSLACEPPCTTFSPAQHPASRSYQQPLGFDRTERKTYIGNLLAFRCFAILWFAWRFSAPSLLETPHLSKMAWLSFWAFLMSIGFEEAIIDSCRFGSIHRKPFRLLGHGLDMKAMNVRCQGGHSHVRIQGKYTKASAIYHPELADFLASHFVAALDALSAIDDDDGHPTCLESVVLNDVLNQGGWTVGASWEWNKPAHINVLESRSYELLLKELVFRGGDCRFTALLDSRVAKGAHAKGRSSALALRPSLLKSCALTVAGNLHPSLGFAPTRLNTSDAPTRDRDLPTPAVHSVLDFLSDDEVAALHSRQFSRASAGWIRLYLLAVTMLSPVEAFGFEASSFCSPLFPDGFWTFLSAVSDFGFGFTVLSLLSLTIVWTFVGCGTWSCNVAPKTNRVNPLLLVALFVLLLLCEAMPLQPAGRDDASRAERRAGVQLQADRVLLQSTRNRREVLLGAFDAWLAENLRTNLHELLDARTLDAEFVSEALVSYGKEMYNAGRSYGKFSETINAVAGRRPALRRHLASAWDLAFNWVVDEPHQHHAALPQSILIAAVSLALLWGWSREAATLALAWTGLLRIGEAFAAKRADLILPRDAAPGIQHALLKIRLPKTRGRAARHQSARIDPCDIVSLLTAVFGRLAPSDALWNHSPQALRKRFTTLQLALGLGAGPNNEVPYTLGSLRPGGATYWLSVTEDSEYVRRKGRWVSSKVLEIYLQETAVATFTSRMTDNSLSRVNDLCRAFPDILEKVIFFKRSCIPESVWPRLW